MTQRRDDLARRVAEDRRAVQDALGGLKSEIGRTFSLRGQMARRPAPWLIGSFCVGLLLGARR